MTTSRAERTLVLVRHAKAEQVYGKPDHDRELAPRGRKDAHAVGRWLSGESQAGALDLALCSSSERTRQTLDEIWAGGVSAKDTRFDERIYDAAVADLLDVLHEVPDSASTVLVIGHGPGLPMLAVALAHDRGSSGDVDERWSHQFPTSGVAVLGFEGPWAALAPDTAYLRAFVVPRG